MPRQVAGPANASLSRLFVENGTAPTGAPLFLQPSAAPSDTSLDEKGNLFYDTTALGLGHYDGTVYRRFADRIAITVPLLAAAVDVDAFLADRAYKVLGFREAHSVVGGAVAAVRPRKITDTSAPGAVAGATVKELTTANIDLTAAINTVVTPTNTATGADLLLATGNRISLDFSGTLTGLVGVLVIFLEQV